ncbi:hypothetical protein OH76DRAFT_1490874 [Lentinus brumalis]|uniref:Uncharacterized protein n=1 Tax=Lentinus brumalis TaxID=2498619 RepID=A0A371CHH6_9APHY|nr:hypothetical protein OH76DRAFT_1490874 [Polyporus brumalis]
MSVWPGACIDSHPMRDEIFRRPLTPAMEQARHYAESGKVCIGPIGAPVSGKDRQLFQVLEELAPELVGNWFEGAYGARFYSSKFQLGQDPTLALGPHYVLLRSLIGAAILSDWNEVAPAVIGVPGSLFQKCASFLEASVRFSQAHMIGGIIYEIPPSVVGAATTDQWLEAFACSRARPLHIAEEVVPMLAAVPPCTLSDTPDEVLDADCVGSWWQTFLPGRKPAHDYTPTYCSSPLAITTPLHPAPSSCGRDAPPPPSPSSTASWDSDTSTPLSGHGVASNEEVPPAPPPTSACGNPEEEETTPPRSFRCFQASRARGSKRPDHGGYVVVVCGQTPWVFPDSVAEKWLPRRGTGHVAFYATFREALEGFRDALRVGRIRGL